MAQWNKFHLVNGLPSCVATEYQQYGRYFVTHFECFLTPVVVYYK